MKACKDLVRKTCRVHGTGNTSQASFACRGAKPCPDTPPSKKSSSQESDSEVDYFEMQLPLKSATQNNGDTVIIQQSAGNKWVKHVQNFQQQHAGMSYKEALVKARPSYYQQH